VAGTWTYTHLTAVPAARNSLDRMQNLLLGPWCGWPTEQVAVLGDLQSPGDLPDRLVTLFGDATDVALFYYVGHGQIDDEDQLCLGLVGSRTEPHRRATTSLPFDAVRRALLRSPAAMKIVILDLSAAVSCGRVWRLAVARHVGCSRSRLRSGWPRVGPHTWRAQL
jgi:hypothetical protein